MRRLLVGAVVLGVGIGGAASPAWADVNCGAAGPLAVCAVTTDDSADVRATSATAPGGGAGVTASTDEATAWVDGNESNQEPASGWVAVTASGDGASADCGTAGSPDGTDCAPAG